MNNKLAVDRNLDYTDQYNQYLSFYDLEMNEPEWLEAWKSQDKEKVEKLLYKWGCDTKYGWEIEVHLHRPRTSNQVEYGPRFQFVERTDKEFAPYVSTEDMIANTKDSFLRSELMTISQQSNFSGSLIDQYGEEEEKI
jgi:hypothetical protein